MENDLKNEVYERELAKLTEIFNSVEDSKKELVDGLIQETAYVKAELCSMRCVLHKTGMIKIHPTNKDMQKVLPIANEYRRTLNIYALNIKTLNGILMKNTIEVEEEDPFGEWIKSKTMSNDNL